MAIQRNAGTDGGNFIKEAGEYRVKVTETKTGLSKSGKPMLTVTFQAVDERLIRGYFVKALAFHMKALEELKKACGMKITDSAEHLLGKSCGILVEGQEPDAQGRVFMSIVGYGPAGDVAGTGFDQTSEHFDEVPF